MKPTNHLITSVILGTAFGVATKSVSGGVAFMLGGTLIDVDHHIDYMITEKKFPFRYMDLYDYCKQTPSPKFYVFLHSYEMMTVFFCLAFYFQAHVSIFGLLLGFTSHIICDNYFNICKPFTYFLLYRIKHGFDRDHICTS